MQASVLSSTTEILRLDTHLLRRYLIGTLLREILIISMNISAYLFSCVSGRSDYAYLEHFVFEYVICQLLAKHTSHDKLHEFDRGDFHEIGCYKHVTEQH